MILRSHVDAVGRHLHRSGQPCLNFAVIFFGKPRGGMYSLPVMNLCKVHNGLPFLSVIKNDFKIGHCVSKINGQVCIFGVKVYSIL